MATYTITILDAAIPVLDKALAAQNALQTATSKPTFRDIGEFLTWLVEREFGISADEIVRKALELREAKETIVDKLSKLTIESLAKVAVAVDEEVGKAGTP